MSEDTTTQDVLGSGRQQQRKNNHRSNGNNKNGRRKLAPRKEEAPDDEGSSRNGGKSTHGNQNSHKGNDKNNNKRKNRGNASRSNRGGVGGKRKTDSQQQEKKQTNAGKKKDNDKDSQPYPSYWSLEECTRLYAAATLAGTHSSSGSHEKGDDNELVVRGKLRVLPAKDAASFVTCDRGQYALDICIPSQYERNRAMDGDFVYVLLDPIDDDEEEEDDDDDDDEGEEGEEEAPKEPQANVAEQALVEEDNELPLVDLAKMKILNGELVECTAEDYDDGGDLVLDGWQEEEAGKEAEEIVENWQDDPLQMNLWNPIVPAKRVRRRRLITDDYGNQNKKNMSLKQRTGRVVHVLPPKSIASELNPSTTAEKSSVIIPNRRIVGSLKVLQGGTILLTPNNKSLPQFKCPSSAKKLLETIDGEKEETEEQEDFPRLIFQAEYEHGSWKESHKWPPCCNLRRMGKACVLEDEIRALIIENEVDHGDFSASVLKDVDDVVQDGLYYDAKANEMAWKPTPEMYQNRRDFRDQRIFTIDPTTAKDLDDALHVRALPDGKRVEIGVHIADVSYFVRPSSPVDVEAQHRTTTVYLVDRTVPMLPRPLCEVACSLNENVERLAFSCVWTMNFDGTLRSRQNQVAVEDVWYGRSVIRSCARLDYATAQNIIDNKVATGEQEQDMDEALWPKNRRPTSDSPHTVDQVAADVRLMHRVAMARRQLRFDNGALALHSVKLAFQLDSDGQTPLMAAPYPIRDSNRLVEEYMLLANYLVAQRLLTHAGSLAVLRKHPAPLMEGLDKVSAVAKAGINFDLDISSSQALHDSLVQLDRTCSDPLVLKCVTQMLMTPMQPAEYFPVGDVPSEEWQHYALNIPYYTHFTSPIRRYPDVIVHRLLQATIDGELAVKNFHWDETKIGEICDHSNTKRLASKNAQERCDRVFLSLFVRSQPMRQKLGVVLSVGVSTFTVYVPDLGANALLFLEEHKEALTFASEEASDGTRRILLQQREDDPNPRRWTTLEITVFTKLSVTINCRDRPPIDIKFKLEGPWAT